MDDLKKFRFISTRIEIHYRDLKASTIHVR